jgi:integrase/recombinase XerD
MDRTKRLSLDLIDWPGRDQAGAAARQAVGPLDDGGLAAGWSVKTVRQAEKGYGLWLGFLARHGRLDPDAAPGARLTRETLTLFGNELLARVAPQTAASRARDLSVMIRAWTRTPTGPWYGECRPTSPVVRRQAGPSASA